VQGRVAHLPYQFLVRISRSDKSQAEDLEVNVLDNSGKPLAGFPQVMPNPLTKTGDSSRKEFEIPVSEAVKKNIEKTLLEKDQFLTHVDLIAGMDDDFLSAHFSNVRLDQLMSITFFLKSVKWGEAIARCARAETAAADTLPPSLRLLRVHFLDRAALFVGSG